MWVTLVLGSIIIGFIYWILYGTYGFWKQRNVPYPEPCAFAGNLGKNLMMKEHVADIYKDIYNKYNNCSWLGVYVFRKPAIFLRNVDLIREIMVKEFSSFHDNDIAIDEKADPLFAKNPFVLKGQRWKFIRSQITGAITSGKLKNMFSFMTNVSKNLVEYLNKEAIINGKDGIDAKDLCARFTTDVVASCAFGLEGNSFTSNPEFKRMGEKILPSEGLNKYKAFLVFASPTIAKYLGLGLLPKNVANWFMGILRETIKYRKENNVVRNDYLDLMLSLEKKLDENEFSELDVMAQSLTFYADGMETSATALSFILYELAKSPDIQQKLRDEIDEVLASHKGEVSYEAVQEMQYLEMVILETLRMHPPAVHLQKLCTKQFTMPNPKGEGSGPGVVIDPGMTVIIPIYSIHYDPEFYPDPERFDPNRFTEEEKKLRPKCTFMPFGEGPRQCLGFRFALMQIKAALVGVISNFEVELNKKTTPDMVVDPTMFLLAKKGGIYLDFKKISK